MKKSDLEVIRELKEKYGNRWKKYYKIRKNYPFGKKSEPQYTFLERRNTGKEKSRENKSYPYKNKR